MDPLNARALARTLCPVPACGAAVILAEVAGERMALNPVVTTVAVPGEAGEFALVQGLQPHACTCVDIVARQAFRAKLEALAL